MQEVVVRALGTTGGGATDCFPEQPHYDIFRTSQQDKNTNV